MKIRDLLVNQREAVENFCEQKAQYAYLGDGVGLCRVLGKYMMYVKAADTSVAPHLIMNGYWESWITQALLRLKPGTTCVDIGANHGYFTLVLADLCGGKVFAFEPQAELIRLISMSADVSGFRDKVITLQSAVGAACGWVKLVSVKGEPNNLGAVWCEKLDLAADQYVEVPPSGALVVTLDDAIQEEIGFIKMDAEGFEPQIWKGMQRHLESRPAILMEFTPGRYEDASGFLDEIEKCYTLREVSDSGSIVPMSREKALGASGFVMLWLEAD